MTKYLLCFAVSVVFCFIPEQNEIINTKDYMRILIT